MASTMSGARSERRPGERAGAVLRQELGDEEFVVVGQRALIEQVIINLATNACDALRETTTWSRHSRRIEPMSRSMCPLCQGKQGAAGRSRPALADRSVIYAPAVSYGHIGVDRLHEGPGVLKSFGAMK
jgi:hypothetical protein